MRTTIRFIYRGRVVSVGVAEAEMPLLDWLRIEQRAVGTKEGCGEGDCGACTVVLARTVDGAINHTAVNACILLLGQVDGAELVTIEDLSRGPNALHPVQTAMLEHHGSQCGFCTPGIVMSLFAQHQDAQRPLSRDAVCDQLAGNLCRCTGYRPIIDAALQAATQAPVAARNAATLADLDALADADDLFVGSDHRFFAAPASEASLIDLIRRFPDAHLVAGATDIGLTITKSLADLRRIVWLGRVRGLDRWTRLDDVLDIGATVTIAHAAAALAGLADDLAEIVRRFGSAQVRNTATVGGNIANGSPIGDLAPCLIALAARVELAGPRGMRSLPLEDFFVAYLQQARRPDEYVRRVIVPVPSPETAFRAYKISKRRDEDISAVLAAFAFTIDSGVVTAARMAFGGMAGIPARATKCEASCVGLRLDQQSGWDAALAALDAEFTPISDHRASADYRQRVARNLLRKALMDLAGDGRADVGGRAQRAAHVQSH